MPVGSLQKERIDWQSLQLHDIFLTFMFHLGKSLSWACSLIERLSSALHNAWNQRELL